MVNHDPEKTYLCRKCRAPFSLTLTAEESAVFEPEEVRRSSTNPKNVLGQYVVVKELGRGGMGAVYKAWDTQNTRWVALKVLMVSGEEEVIRFRREAETAASFAA